ncbi:HNH endonuclease [Paenisporosarcina macmurdoensis]|uniref:HNH endonuclease n=1 Tax=Paenisporosarcina macmurdoensis TaxID=212659 RepID=A0ABW1L6F4_9BACL
MLSLEDYEILASKFTDFATEKAKLRPRTIIRYMVVIDDYFKNCVLERARKTDYMDMFNINRLSLIKRKSNNVRPSLLHFLEFLKEEEFIDDEYVYYQLQNNIKAIFVTEELDRGNDVTFLTPKELRFILSDKISCRSDYDKNLLSLMCSLSFFHMFKQEDFIALSIQDIDLENNRIKNIRRTDSDSELLEWLSINETTFAHLQNYLKLRSAKDGLDTLLIQENEPLNNSKINNLLRIFELASNREFVGNQRINTGLLIRTMMLYILVSSKGQGIYQILLEQERNTYFDDAFNEYLSIRRSLNKDIVGHDWNLEDILPKQRRHPNVIGAYSSENDIDEEDLKEFDCFNERNLEMQNVTIQRLVRDSKVSRELKNLYDNECQLCGFKLRKANSEFLSEGHHIQPYNNNHRGDDNSYNIIILCPNCHAQFDDLYFALNPQTEEVHCIFEAEDDYHLSKLKMKEGHTLDVKYLEFTWKLFVEKKKKY